MGAAETFAKILARQGISFSSGGQDYTGIRTTVRSLREILPQGLRESYQFSLVVPVATGEAIDNDARVTVGSTTYRTPRRSSDGPGITTTLHLIDD